jgi:hypothetical protein
VTASEKQPPRNARTLRSWVDGRARAEGMTTGRLQRWVSYMVLVGALDRVRDLQGEPLFLVKGGVAMELRLKLEARATKDFDATFRHRADEMIGRLDEALREPYGGFTLTRSEIEDVGPTTAKRLNVSLAYRGRSWSSIKLELSPARSEAGMEVERVPAVDLSQFGLEGPETVPCVAVRYQIAQKLHACTARRTDGKDNDRFRDLVDLILLRGLLAADDLPAVRDACVQVFELRSLHSWPPTVEVPASWAAPYGRLADDLDFVVRDVEHAADRVTEIVREIDEAGDLWTVISGPEEVLPVADRRRYRWVVARGEDRREVFVEVSGSASATEPSSLPFPLEEAVRSRGASELVKLLDRTEPPARIVIDTGRVTIVPRMGP